MDIVARVVSRWLKASPSDDPRKWQGLTQNYQKNKGKYKRHKKFKDYTMHWLPGRGPIGEGYFDIVVTNDQDRVIATLFYGPGDVDGFLEGAIEVDPDFRRQGIASALYDWAETLDGRKFQPASSHTQDAEAFWKARRRR